MGPNVKRLMIKKVSHDMVPDGGGFADGLSALTDGGMGRRVQDATLWVQKAIKAVKQTPDNPHGDDDEAIAGEILRQIAKKA